MLFHSWKCQLVMYRIQQGKILRIENEVSTFTFPAHGLVVGVVVASGVGGGRTWGWVLDCAPCLRVCRHLNGFTVGARTAPPLALRRPRTDLGSPHCLLIFLHCLEIASCLGHFSAFSNPEQSELGRGGNHNDKNRNSKAMTAHHNAMEFCTLQLRKLIRSRQQYIPVENSIKTSNDE